MSRFRLFAAGAAMLVLLPVAAHALGQDDFKTFELREFNFKISYPAAYHKVRNPNTEFQFTAQKGPETAFLIAVLETPLSLDELLKAVRDELAVTEKDRLRDISVTPTRVAGMRAAIWKSELKDEGKAYVRYGTFIVRQGIAYRIVGVTLKDSLDFTLDYMAFIKSVEFTGDRKEWLEKYEGKPVNIALLGGLVSLEINQPRWVEDSWSDKSEYGIVEHAKFSFMPGGAWIQIRGLASQRSAEDELATVHRLLEPLMTDYQAAQLAPQPGIAFPVGEFTGSLKSVKHIFRTAALVEEGVALRVYMECLESQRGETENDWKQLLRSLKLRKKSDPAAIQAYVIPERNNAAVSEPSAALKAIFAAAKLVVSTDVRKQVIGVSPDGKSALVTNGAACHLVDIITRQEIKLRVPIPAEAAVAFSPDSKLLAWPAENQIHLLALPAQTETTLKVNARQVAFAASGDDLLVSVPVAEHALTDYIPHLRLDTSTLQRVTVKDGRKSALVEFPFSRCESAAISSDRKRIALMCNRDNARTKAAHVYLCNADGSNLKQLTRGSEEFSRLAWSPDGTALYGFGGPRKADYPLRKAEGDVYRIDAATGQCSNLTKCNEIQDAWFAGNDLFLDIGGYFISDEKKGLHRISGSELERALAAVPVPPHTEMKELVPRIAEKVKSAFGGKNIDTLVLDQENIKKAARAFADVAGPALNVKFDFSKASLKHLQDLQYLEGLDQPAERAYFLGAGAYYGETLRQSSGAEWKLKPLPFGQWLPAANPGGNAILEVSLPFSAIHGGSIHNRDYNELSEDHQDRENSIKRILVYPPEAAASLIAEATDPSYLEAFKRLDAGEIEKAGDLLAKVMAAHPRNSRLAREAISLCEAAGLPELSKRLVRSAVDNGSEVTELLVRCGDEAAEKDPAKAMQLYRRATKAIWGAEAALIKLGKLYAAQNKPEIARSCWRRVLLVARGKERNAAIKLLDPDAKVDPNAEDFGLDE